MMQSLSPNTQAILLLTAPLIVKHSDKTSELLAPGEYKRLAFRLRELGRQPADLLAPDAAAVLRACQPVIDSARLQRLLERGFLLSQVFEHWQTRALWVLSRADPEYPQYLKSRFREDAPAVLYGCGDMRLLEAGGLAVVGSRHVNDALIEYTMSIGDLAATAGKSIISGGAKGIDQASMRGALEAGGKVCGVLADSLEKSAMNREHRNLLLDGQLVLISPYDPKAGFNAGNAMRRNKLIYALAEAALVVNSDLNKGGTWNGAKEQLEKFNFVPVYVRSTEPKSEGLDALQKKGALPWPNPDDADSFLAVFNEKTALETDYSNVTLSLFDKSASVSYSSSNAATNPSPGTKPSTHTEDTPADILFSTARAMIQRILKNPMKDTEVAAALDVSNAQAKIWLQQLVKDGIVEKHYKPVRYALRNPVVFRNE